MGVAGDELALAYGLADDLLAQSGQRAWIGYNVLGSPMRDE